MDYLTPRPELYNVPFYTDEFNGMPYSYAGASGLRTPAIGLGTWKFGYPDSGDEARVGPGVAFDIFDRAIELGVTFWDTANRYNAASGNSERVIGRWFASNPDQRRNVIVATKLCGGMDGVTPNHSGLSRGSIIDAVRASLARLQLDYLDVLWFHRFDSQVPIEESLETVEDLVRDGHVRYLAVSNFSVEQLSSYLSVADQLSRRCRPIAVQNQFDPLNGESAEHQGALRFCADNGLAYIPYSPLARGLLTNRYLDRARVGAGDRLHDEGLLDADNIDNQLAVVRRLDELARKQDLDVSQLVLAYIRTLPGMGTQIPSSSTVDQLESNAIAGKVTLTEEQIAEVGAVFSS